MNNGTTQEQERAWATYLTATDDVARAALAIDAAEAHYRDSVQRAELARKRWAALEARAGRALRLVG